MLISLAGHFRVYHIFHLCQYCSMEFPSTRSLVTTCNMTVRNSVCLSVCLSLSLSLYLSLSLCVFLSVSLSLFLFVCLSVSLCLCVCVSLSNMVCYAPWILVLTTHGHKKYLFCQMNIFVLISRWVIFTHGWWSRIWSRSRVQLQHESFQPGCRV